MIPTNITKEHVLKAIKEISKNGVPDNRLWRKFKLNYDGSFYPPKYTIALANKYANNQELDSEAFSGGKESNKFLEALGFEIIKPSDVDESKGNKTGKSKSNTAKSRNITVRQDKNPAIGRVIVCGNWWVEKQLKDEALKKKIIDESNNEAALILSNVCKAFQKNGKVKKIKYLITSGGFLQFLWPKIENSYNPKNPPKNVVQELTKSAEKACESVLDAKLKEKIKSITDFITIGVDAFASGPYSAKGVFKPLGIHIEFVGLLDLKKDEYHWTRKFFPTAGFQEEKLVRNTDLDSHFLELEEDNVMILGCHDLNVYNRRGFANDNPDGWRRQIRKEFMELAKKKKPAVVLQHPHHTEKRTTWRDAINNMKNNLEVKSFASAGRYDSEDKNNLFKVLESTKIGSTIDFIVSSK